MTTRRDELDDYLEALGRELRGLPAALVADLVGELRSHVRDSVGGGEPSRAELRHVLARLGSPAELAAQYRDAPLPVTPDRASCVRAGWERVRWRVMNAAGVLPLLAVWLLGACLLIAALHKPLAPERVGLWRLDGDEISLHLGFRAAPAAGEELLGWWIVPLGLLAGAGAGWLALRVALLSLRLVRERLAPRYRGRGEVLWRRT